MLAALRALFRSTATFLRSGSLKLSAAVAFAVFSTYWAWSIYRDIRVEQLWVQTHPVLCYNQQSRTILPMPGPEPKVLDEQGVHSQYQRYWAVPGDRCVYVLEYKEQEQEWQ